MTWLDNLCDLFEQRSGHITGEQRRAIRQSERAVFGSDPPVLVCRAAKRTRQFPGMGGALYYDPSPNIALSAGEDIYIDDVFYTYAQCEIWLPQRAELSLIPQKGVFRLFAKRPSGGGQWKVKTTLPETTLRRVEEAVLAADDGAERFYALFLQPVSETEARGVLHRLSVRTDIFRDELGQFCIFADYYPIGENGERLNAQQAAARLLGGMVDLCGSVWHILAGG